MLTFSGAMFKNHDKFEHTAPSSANFICVRSSVLVTTNSLPLCVIANVILVFHLLCSLHVRQHAMHLHTKSYELQRALSFFLSIRLCLN
jgi:hypothetical protein